MSVVQEAQLNGMSDEQLKVFVCELFENLSRIEEEKKSDEEVKERKEAYDNFVKERYGNDVAEIKGKLKIVRSLAKLRGLNFNHIYMNNNY